MGGAEKQNYKILTSEKIITLIIVLVFVNIQNAHTITGKLVDQNGNGLSGLLLKLYINPKVFTTTSSTNGSFTFGNITNVKETELPAGYSVSNNYPNPFNPRTRIEVTLAKNSKVNVGVFNLLGQKVTDEIERYFGAGKNSLDLELNGLSNGIYFARISIDNKYTVVRKLILIYGSQHLMSFNFNSLSQLNKTTLNGLSIQNTKIDSLVVTDPSIVKKVFTNLPSIIDSYLNLGNLMITRQYSIPDSIIHKSNMVIISKVGQKFFDSYIKLDSSRSNFSLPDSFCIKNPSRCADYLVRPYYRFTYQFNFSNNREYSAYIEFVVDTNGIVVPSRPVFGIPQCPNNDCWGKFNVITKEKAIEIARQHGLEEGIKEWVAKFHFSGGPIQNYVWSVTNTLTENNSTSSGKGVLIDCLDGKIYQWFNWISFID